MDFHSLAVGLDVVLGILAVVFGSSAATNGRLKMVALAIAAAEHGIDKAAFKDDGSLNEARVDAACAILDHLLPKADPHAIHDDVVELLNVVHKHAQDLKTS